MRGEPEPLVLFDMDGVLITGRGSDPAVHARAMEDVASAWDLEIPPDLREPLAAYPYSTALEAACAALGVDAARFFDAREARSAARIAARVAAGRRPLYDDVDVLEPLSEMATLGVVSNNYDPAVTAVVDHHGLDAFTHTRGRDVGLVGFRRRKPDPHYLAEAMDALGHTSGVYVGDRQTDVEAAQAAGLTAVYLRRSHNRATSLRVAPDVELDGLGRLPVAVAELLG
jgi:HAD superfamily hydrolase (TIGR01549 family)